LATAKVEDCGASDLCNVDSLAVDNVQDQTPFERRRALLRYGSSAKMYRPVVLRLLNPPSGPLYFRRPFCFLDQLSQPP
jgi:hypothetical protein